MEPKYEEIIKNDIAPIVQSGRAILFLGAGYSCDTMTLNKAGIPLAFELVKRILRESGHTDVEADSIDLQSAFSLGEDEIPDFYDFLCKNFLCTSVSEWQKIPFYHWWRRIYTTNIDNVIDVCISNIKSISKSGPKYEIFNYRDRAPAIYNPLKPPIVYLHGKLNDPTSGFVFDGVSYADHSVKSGDWLYDAALHLSAGHCIILGSKLKESDLETELRKRTIWDKSSTKKIGLHPNWIVLNKFNSVEISGYEKRGLIPIVATSQEFLECLAKNITIMSEAKFLKKLAPHLHIESTSSMNAVAWFSTAFSHIPTVVRSALHKKGIQSRFFAGDSPDWYYIANEVQANFDYKETLLQSINNFLIEKKAGNVFLLAITGAVASGKTTLCRSLMHHIAQTNDAVYEYSSLDGIDIDAAWSAIKNIKGTIAIFIDRSSEHFYAINDLAKRFIHDKTDAKLLFIIEERDIPFQKNKHHLFAIPDSNKLVFKVPSLSLDNAKELVSAMMAVGIRSDRLPEETKEAARAICDKEKGYRGDLLATLCDITGNRSFKEQLLDEFNDICDEKAKHIFKLLTIVTAARLSIPIKYLSEICALGTHAVMEQLNDELVGKVFLNDGLVSSRHQVIAEYHLEHMIDYNDKEDLIVDLMQCVARKYNVKEIKFHPLPYRIYKGVLNHSFLRTYVFPKATKRIENIYSKCQSFFVNDGIFWLQYGKFLYLEERYDEAEHCFRKGLGIYDSFQIRHALGQVLLKLYVKGKCINNDLLDEGLSILVHEIVARGETDPYPYNTLCQGLIEVLSIRHDETVSSLLRHHANQGLKFHRSDSSFQSVIQKGIAKGFLGFGG